MQSNNELKLEFNLFDFLLKLVNKNTELNDKLLYQKKISLLEIYKPHLVLYVFPNLVKNNLFSSIIRCFKLFVKILLLSYKQTHYNLEIKENETSKHCSNSKNIALINITRHFYEESLKKLSEKNSTNINFFTFEINKFKKKSSNELLKSEFFKSSIILIKNINTNRKEIINELGNIHFIELYLNIFFLFNIILPGHIDFIKKIDHKLQKFDVVITNDFAEPISRFILFISKLLKVKTVTIQQGISSMTYPEWAFNFSDYTFISGEKTKEHIEYQNKDLKNIFITGIPNFDIEKRKKNKVKIDNWNILLATQPYFPNSFESNLQRIKIFYSIIILCLFNKKICLTIKSHPSESQFIYKLFALLFKRVNITNDKIIEIIPNYDVFITSFSQTSLYSLLYGVPTINVYFGTKSCHTDFIYSGASILISSIHELKYTLKNLEEINNYNFNYLKLTPWIYNRDNNSVNRIIQKLNDI